MGDYIIKRNSIVLDKDLQYDEEPVVIIDHEYASCKPRRLSP